MPNLLIGGLHSQSLLTGGLSVFLPSYLVPANLFRRLRRTSSDGYNIYKNDGAGGPIDYTTVYLSTSATSIALPPLSLNSDNLFGVRVYDTVTGLEDKNVDAIVHIVIDGTGADITNRPAPAIYVSARADAAGKATVMWSHNRTAEGGVPTGFKVWLTIGSSVDYGVAPDTIVPYQTDPNAIYRTALSGLTDGTVYTIGVRSYNATGLSLTSTEPSVTGRVSTAPDTADEGSTSVGFAP